MCTAPSTDRVHPTARQAQGVHVRRGVHGAQQRVRALVVRPVVREDDARLVVLAARVGAEHDATGRVLLVRGPGSRHVRARIDTAVYGR